MIENIAYPFKVWITAVLVGPLLMIALILLFDADNNTIFNGIYPLLYLLGYYGSNSASYFGLLVPAITV